MKWFTRRDVITRVWVQDVAAASSGALTVLGFAPFGLFIIPLFTLTGLLILWRDATPARAFRSGWLFGLGFLGCGIFWLRISINQFGGVELPLAQAITLGFIALMALYFGLVGGLGCRLAQLIPMRHTIIFPAIWVLVEGVRGWLFGGFPWLSLGYSQIDSPLAGYAPLLGVYGITAALMISAGLLARACTATPRLIGMWWLLLALLPWGGGALLWGKEWTQPTATPLRVSVIQANIPQTLKWDPAQRQPTLETYARLTREVASDSDLVIWPETAVPDFLHRVERHWLSPFGRELAARGTALVVGVPVMETAGERYYNAAIVVNITAERYYKRHLVPFGEFLPFKPWLGPLLDFLHIPMSDFSSGQNTPPHLHVQGIALGMSICYEDAFGDAIRTALPDAGYLVNLSNDAWFGDSLAPHQHLEIARMRALETGRPLLRATNTGISALIGSHGQLLAVTQPFTIAVLNAQLSPYVGMTPYARWGDNVIWLLALLAIGVGRWIKPNG